MRIEVVTPVAERLFLGRYMRRLIEQRALAIRDAVISSVR
jgi:hypothetical protein